MNIENYAIKNFRVFDENGVSFPLRPVSIITGCNSSGKSSIVKSVFLLKSFLEQVKNAYAENSRAFSIDNFKIDFTKYPNNLLGKFDKVVNNSSESKKITIAYTVYSRLLSKDIEVCLVFFSPENDELNNAYLESVTMSIEGEVFFFSSRNKKKICNLNLIKDSFFDYDKLKTMGTDIVEWSKQNASFFFIPLFQHLDTLNKSNLWTYISSTILNDAELNDADGDFAFVSKRIIDDFCNSEHSRFSEYFKEKECLFFDNTTSGEGLSLLNTSDLFIKNESYFRPEVPKGILRYLKTDLDEQQRKKAEEILSPNQKQQINLKKLADSLPFNLLYYISMKWNSIFTKKEEYDHYRHANNLFEGWYYEHILYKELSIYAAKIAEGAICLDGIDNMSYVSSSRAVVKRLYSLESQDDFSNLLRKYFESKQRIGSPHEYGKKYEPNSFINKWIQKFGIGESVSMNVNEDGLGVQIKIKKNEKDERLLADEGYGITQLVSILLQIETAILSPKPYSFRTYKRGNNEPTTIAIEEPEIHLHPKYQSLLADMIVDAYKSYNIHFMIETHSEYLIRKLQLLVANKKIDSDEVSILYVNSAEDDPDGKVQVKSIQICKDGYLDDSFGPGFFDEATSLSRQLM